VIHSHCLLLYIKMLEKYGLKHFIGWAKKLKSKAWT